MNVNLYNIHNSYVNFIMVYWPVFTSLCTYHNTLTMYSLCWYLLGRVLVLVFCLFFHSCFDHFYTHSFQYEPYSQFYKFYLRFLIKIIDILLNLYIDLWIYNILIELSHSEINRLIFIFNPFNHFVHLLLTLHIYISCKVYAYFINLISFYIVC